MWLDPKTRWYSHLHFKDHSHKAKAKFFFDIRHIFLWSFPLFAWCKWALKQKQILSLIFAFPVLFLPPANEVSESYVFKGVCLSTGDWVSGICWDTPPWQTPPPGQTPPCSACWDTVNKRVVHIPLECILVFLLLFVSLHIRSMWETICDAQAGFCTLTSNSKFVPKFSRKPLSGISDKRAPPLPKIEI